MSSTTVGLLLPGTFLRHPDTVSGEPGSSVAGRELLRALLTYSEVPLTLFVSEYHADTLQRECLTLSDITGFDTFPHTASSRSTRWLTPLLICPFWRCTI